MKIKNIKLVTLIITFVSLLAVTFFIWFTINTNIQFKKYSRENLIQYGNMIYRDIAFASSDYLFTNSYPSLKYIVSEFTHRPYVREISVINPENIIIADLNNNHLGEAYPVLLSCDSSDSPCIQYERNLMQITGPVLYENIKLGYISITLSMKDANNQLMSIMYRNLIWSFIILLISILVTILGSKLVTSPVVNLSRSIERLAEGDYSRVEKRQIIRELHDLQYTFNGMTEKLICRESQLTRAKQEAEKANDTKSIFLANISHELKTPLNGILGFISLLEHSSLSEEQKSHLKNIRVSGETLSSVIRNLLDFIDLETGSCKLIKNSFSLEDLTVKISRQARVLIDNKPIRFTCHSRRGVVKADHKRIEQILIILLSNAVKFTNKGRIQLKICEGQNLTMIVSDTGRGIPESKKNSLFEIFNQVDNPLTKSNRGIGAGLPIARKLTELMGGSIQIESCEGKGTTVSVNLPYAVHPIPHALPKKASGLSEISFYGCTENLQKTNQPGKILLVEDEAINRLYLTMMLKKRGYSVKGVSDGNSAIQAFEEENIILILMDIGLPGMNGIETTEKIVNLDRYCACPVPVIAVTANTQHDISQKCLDAGMKEIISKPINEKILLDAISNAIEQVSRVL